MTDTPHLHALAMRTAAVSARWEDHVADNSPKYLTDWQRGLVAGQQAMRAAILALPLEADHAALVAEAVRLPEIAALIKASAMAWQGLVGEYGHYKARVNFCELEDALQPFLALETP